MGTKIGQLISSQKYPGVRWRVHPTRKHGVLPDRYFAVRYQYKGQRKEEGLGWASEGWSEQKAALELANLKQAAKLGEGPTRLTEKRALTVSKRQLEAEIKKQQVIDSLTFNNFWQDTYFPQAQKDKTPGSWRREEQFYRLWLAPVIGNYSLRDVSPIHLERIKKNMTEAGRAPRSIQYCLAVVRQVFNHARRLDLYQGDSPTSKVKIPKTDNRRLRFLSLEEASALLKALAKENLQLHDLALLSLHTGMRVGEVLSLTWADVDLEQGLLTLRDTKNGRSRYAYMTAEVKAILAKLVKGSPSDLVFIRLDGIKYNYNTLSAIFRGVAAKLGLNVGITDPRQLVCFHSLRHTYASWLVMGGTPLYTVQRLLGHQSSAMTERYSHLAPDHLRDAVKGLENFLKNPKEKKIIGEVRVVGNQNQIIQRQALRLGSK